MNSMLPNLTLEELQEVFEESTIFVNFDSFVQWFWAQFARQGGM